MDHTDSNLDALAAAYRDIERRVQLAAVDSLRARAAAAHPEAAFFTLVDSDQGPWLTGDRLYDSGGHRLHVDDPGDGIEVEFDDAGLGSWLIDDGYWQCEVAPQEQIAPLADTPSDPGGREFWFQVRPDQAPPTATIRVRRTFLTAVTQEWEVDIPTDWHADEWLENDQGGFDQYVCDVGGLVDEESEPVDDRYLELSLVDPVEGGVSTIGAGVDNSHRPTQEAIHHA